jgi:DNA-binding beta-propeller fold protein YncE
VSCFLNCLYHRDHIPSHISKMSIKAKRTRSTASSPSASGDGKRQKQGNDSNPQYCLEQIPLTAVSSFGYTSLGPPVASEPGLYDCRGILLVAVPCHDKIKAKIFDQEYTLQVQPGDETLTITRWMRSDDREDRCRTFVEDRANEIERRKLDMKALQVDLSAKMAEFEDEYLYTEPGDIEKGLADLVALRGKHKAELKELESCADVKIPITQTSQGESVVLQLKELIQVGFFGTPVVYRKGPLVAAAVQVTEVVEKTEVALSAWQVEQIEDTYVSTLGIGQGVGEGQLNAPRGLAVSDDSVFVADTEDHRVSVFSRRSGASVRMFGSKGARGGQLDSPCCLTVSGEHVFVADTGNHRISVHTKQGVFVRTIGNGQGSDDGQLDAPVGVTVSGEHLLVADTSNHRVSVFTVGGGFIRSFGTYGSAPGQLHNPTGVAVSGDLVFVADQANHRISVFRQDGWFVGEFGSKGAGNGQFRHPTGVCVVGDRVFVTDLTNHRVSVHRLDGTFVREFGTEGVGYNQFKQPGGVVVAGDRLFVADWKNHRVQVFM